MSTYKNTTIAGSGGPRQDGCGLGLVLERTYRVTVYVDSWNLVSVLFLTRGKEEYKYLCCRRFMTWADTGNFRGRYC